MVVGDIVKGLMVFDLVEGRNSKFSLSEGPSSGQVNSWVNDILILASDKYLVVDHSRNIFIFKRNLKPTNEIEKFSLQIEAQINCGEEVTCLTHGSINMQQDRREIGTTEAEK